MNHASTSPSGTGTRSIREGLGLSRDRSAQPRGDRRLPEGVVVVSGDSHWSIAEDIFVERAPSAMKDLMPRVSYEPGQGLQMSLRASMHYSI
jgi:hypothetical protein